jgi:hypothetical protein
LITYIDQRLVPQARFSVGKDIGSFGRPYWSIAASQQSQFDRYPITSGMPSTNHVPQASIALPGRAFDFGPIDQACAYRSTSEPGHHPKIDVREVRRSPDMAWANPTSARGFVKGWRRPAALQSIAHGHRGG